MKKVLSNLWGAFKEIMSYLKEPFLFSILFVDLLDLILNIFSNNMSLIVINFFFAILITKILLKGGIK